MHMCLFVKPLPVRKKSFFSFVTSTETCLFWAAVDVIICMNEDDEARHMQFYSVTKTADRVMFGCSKFKGLHIRSKNGCDTSTQDCSIKPLVARMTWRIVSTNFKFPNSGLGGWAGRWVIIIRELETCLNTYSVRSMSTLNYNQFRVHSSHKRLVLSRLTRRRAGACQHLLLGLGVDGRSHKWCLSSCLSHVQMKISSDRTRMKEYVTPQGASDETRLPAWSLDTTKKDSTVLWLRLGRVVPISVSKTSGYLFLT